MSWIKLDDQWMDHPKIIKAGRDARDMWLASITWCAKHLTDGYFPAELLPSLAVTAGVDVANCLTLASSLLDACLWDSTDNGYMVHDYLDYNPTKEQTEINRIARSAAGKAGGQAKSKQKSSKIQANGQAKSKQKSTPSPSPSPSPIKKIGADAPTNPSEKKTKKEPDPRTNHPAIVLVHTITKKYPNTAVYDKIISAVGEIPDSDKANKCFSAWVERGYNPNALIWLTEWYVNGIPERNGKMNKTAPEHKYREEF